MLSTVDCTRTIAFACGAAPSVTIMMCQRGRSGVQSRQCSTTAASNGCNVYTKTRRPAGDDVPLRTFTCRCRRIENRCHCLCWKGWLVWTLTNCAVDRNTDQNSVSVRLNWTHTGHGTELNTVDTRVFDCSAQWGSIPFCSPISQSA